MPALAELAGDLLSSASGAAPSFGAAGRGDRHDPMRCRPEGHGSVLRVLLAGCGAELPSQLRSRLLQPHWTVTEARSGAEALELLQRCGIDVVVLASRLPDLDVAEFRDLVQVQAPSVQIIGLDGAPWASSMQGKGGSLHDLMRLHTAPGGSAALSPPALRSLRSSVERSSSPGWGELLGSTAAMQRVFQMAKLVARRDTTVLIQGESGTGKDLLARSIHQAGPREKQPFVVINCAAIPETLLEAELFGYAKGAFTGATQARMGRVHAAHGGTLFLDEIGDMPLPLQSKILRFLEQGEVQRIGGTDTSKVDCRIIAATNVNLKEQVSQRQFREDLYYRLAVMPIALPPLRERMDDLPLLCSQLMARFCPGAALHPEAMDLLLQHSWPGNVRELRNVMERASLFADGRTEILAEDIVL